MILSMAVYTVQFIPSVLSNAGIMPLSPIAKGDVDSFDKVIVINLRGAFLVFAQAVQHAAEGGRIIALSRSVLAKSFQPTVPILHPRPVSRDWSTFSRMNYVVAT